VYIRREKKDIPCCATFGSEKETSFNCWAEYAIGACLMRLGRFTVPFGLVVAPFPFLALLLAVSVCSMFALIKVCFESVRALREQCDATAYLLNLLPGKRLMLVEGNAALCLICSIPSSIYALC
jgi:hypothetical protein